MRLALLVLLFFGLVFAQEVTTPDGSYTDISPDELNERLSKDGQFLLVNTHIPYEGEIKGTDSFLPYNEVESYFPILPKDKDADIVVYCMSGRMSEIAAETLVKLGYSNVKNLSGGMIAWEQAGYDLVDAFERDEAAGDAIDMDMVSAKVGVPRHRFVTAGIEGDAALGNQEAQLVLVEFSDFNCPYCAKFHLETLPDIVETFVDSGELRYVYRDFVSVGGQASARAAETAECLREQVGDAQYLDIINALYAAEGRKTSEVLLNLVGGEVDRKSLDTCAEERRYRQEVEADLNAARAAGARGTPAFVLGYLQADGQVEGVLFQGALPFETFQTYIGAFIEAAQ